jgi:predicted nucleotidyltransferase
MYFGPAVGVMVTNAVVARHGARRVRLLGSRARGDARPDSDADLLVRLDEGRDLLDLIALRQELEERFGLRFDVVTKAALSPHLRERVLAGAREVA